MTAFNVIIVLGGRNDRDGLLSPMAISRATRAREEFRFVENAKMLLTAGHGHFNHAPKPHAYYVKKFLIEKGLKETDFLPHALSTNTVEDAGLSSHILHDHQIDSICVVTSEFHVRRSQLIFEHFFNPRLLKFVGVPNGVPAKRLQSLLAHESLGIQQIKCQGGVIFNGQLYPRIG